MYCIDDECYVCPLCLTTSGEHDTHTVRRPEVAARDILARVKEGVEVCVLLSQLWLCVCVRE